MEGQMGVHSMVNALEAMSGMHVLIIGDMVADVYLDGTIARISREAS